MFLKVGHHGSKGSSSDVFLDQLHPQLALISVGKKNRYQHPHKELLDRLEERSISYLRTDEGSNSLDWVGPLEGRNGPLETRRGLLSMLKIAIIEGEINVKVESYERI